MIDNKAYDDLKQTKSQINGQYMINATKDRHDDTTKDIHDLSTLTE
jgi:hypothetical protein